MPRCPRLTVKGMNSLGRCAFFTLTLKRLHLGHNPFIHDEALPIFSRALELNSLNLEYTDVTEAKALQLQSKFAGSGLFHCWQGQRVIPLLC
jgi:hypothetical protein